MEELVEKVVEQLNEVPIINENKIKMYIELFQNKIKSICKRCDFPSELNYMCVEFARKRYLYFDVNNNGSSAPKVEVTSASDNGQSVSFKTIEIISADEVDVDKVVEKNMTEISNYAYMGW